MTKLLARLAILHLLVALAPLLAAVNPQPSVRSAATGNSPVVLELFTSEGCSSCPPADRLLSELVNPEHGPSTNGQRLIALAFHVDYWNRLGWRDRFSTHRWTARQQLYAARVARGNVYTPQLIVQGKSNCVGSDRRCIESAIASARARAPMARLTVQPDPVAPDGTLRAKLQLALRGASPRGARVLVVLFENGIVSRVGAGENSGRTLRHDFVVRTLALVPTPTPELESPGMAGDLYSGGTWRRTETITPRLRLPPHADPDRWGIAVLYQRPAGKILAADAVWPLSPAP